MTLGNEDALARRITYERERRHWSPSTLARKMTGAGCPMTQSAIWRIEHGEPRRRINVDEAVTLAQLFGVSVDDLLTPPELDAEPDLGDLLAKYEASYGVAASHNAALFAAKRSCDEVAADIANLVARRPEAGRALADVLAEKDPESRRVDNEYLSAPATLAELLWRAFVHRPDRRGETRNYEEETD